MREAVIVSAVRTPVGRFRGSLASVPAHTLGSIVVREAVRRARIQPHQIDEIIFSNLMNHEYNNIARMVALDAGLPVEVPAISIDRQCASSLNALAYAAIFIQAGQANCIVAGGVESDSRRPYVMEKPSASFQFSPPAFLNPRFAPEFIGDPPMGITAENLVEKYNLNREELDEFALSSHQKAARAWAEGRFDEQIVPVEVPLGKGKTQLFEKDEILREDASLESLARLAPAFKKGGIVTAGNSSAMSDGAGAMVVMERELAQSLGLEILAVFKGYAAAGVDPNYMGLGPVPAIKKLLKTTNTSLESVDLIEINEAFAAQSIPCIRELNLDIARVNVNGGAIALGHPLAGTGAILTAKMVYELKRSGLKRGIISFCCGGGQGVALMLERA